MLRGLSSFNFVKLTYEFCNLRIIHGAALIEYIFESSNNISQISAANE